MSGIPYIGEILSLSAALFWAIGVIFFKLAGERMPPLALNLYKNCVALVLLPITMLIASQSFFPEVPLEWWLLMAASGVIGIAVADTMFFFSLEKLGAGLTAVVDTTYTPLMLGMSFFFLSEDMAPKSLVGAVLIMGALLVGSAARPDKGKTRRDIIIGTVVGILGIFLMAIGIVMIKGILSDVPILWATTVRIAAATVALIPMMIFHPRRRLLFKSVLSSKAWTSAFPAAVFGTYLAMIVWIGGMKYIDVHRAALLNQMSAIFIFVFAVIFLKEPLTRRRLMAISLAATGAFLVAY